MSYCCRCYTAYDVVDAGGNPHPLEHTLCPFCGHGQVLPADPGNGGWMCGLVAVAYTIGVLVIVSLAAAITLMVGGC